MIDKLAWGAKVSPAFRQRVREIAFDLHTDPNWLMACMAFETGRTFSASVKNAAGSGAVGLIQFMPQTAAALGTTTAKLAAMTAEGQLDFVARYFAPWRGRLKNIGDVYSVIFWPAAVGKPDTTVLFDRSKKPVTYLQNRGLDGNHDGEITRAEIAARVVTILGEGQLPRNLA